VEIKVLYNTENNIPNVINDNFWYKIINFFKLKILNSKYHQEGSLHLRGHK